jgi:hypothetical protein
MNGLAQGFVPRRMVSMLMMKQRRPTIRTLRGWAISVLQDAGAIRECEEHGWMQDRADPHARERAFNVARQNPPAGVSSQAAAVAIAEVLDSMGDKCPECPAE